MNPSEDPRALYRARRNEDSFIATLEGVENNHPGQIEHSKNEN